MSALFARLRKIADLILVVPVLFKLVYGKQILVCRTVLIGQIKLLLCKRRTGLYL